MPTNVEILGDDVAVLLSQGKSIDEITAIAKDRLKNPPQIIAPQMVQAPQADNIPAWYKGESGNGLVDFGGDVLRGVGHTGLSYYNLLQGGDEKTTKLLQKLEGITEAKKAVGRAPEREAEVKQLQDNYSKAQTFSEKFKAGLNTVTDTLSNPSEWQVGEFVGENLDPINLLPAGKGILAGVTIGGITNGVQAGAFTLPRTDKSGLDAAVDAALGTTAGAVLGGFTGGFTKVAPSVEKEKSVKKGSDKKQSDYEAAMNDLGVQEPAKSFDVDTAEAEIVKKKSYKTFSEIINKEETSVKNVDAVVKGIGDEMLKAGATAEQIEIRIAEELKPSAESLAITNILNDGLPVTPRLSGLNIQQAIINSIQNPTKTAPEFFDSMIIHGFTEEIAAAATKAYETKEIAHFSTFAHDKLAANMGELVDIESVKAEAKNDILKIANSNQIDISYKLAHDALPIEETRTATQQSALFGDEQQLFDVASESRLVTPKWAEHLVSSTTRYEDIIREVTNAKNGETPTPLAQRAMLAMARDELQKLSSHERYGEVLDFTRELRAKDSKYSQRLEQAGAGRELDGYGGTDKMAYDNASYSKNYAHDFTLTKSRVNRIENGKATLQDIQSLKADLDMIENNPIYALPTEAELKAKYEEWAFNPASIYDFIEFEKLQQKFDPETYAEAREMFGYITKKEEITNDTSHTRNLARDSKNTNSRDRNNERVDADERGAGATNPQQTQRVNGADELSKQSYNSTPDSPAALLREQGDTKLSTRESATAASARIDSNIEPARSGGVDGNGVQTRQNTEAATGSKPKQKQKQSGNEDVGASTADIKDFGEKIGGARKDLFKNSEVDTSKFTDFTSNELFKSVKKAKVFKAIDYREFAATLDADKLYASSPDLFDAIGITPKKSPLLIAHFVKTIKDSIAAPKNGWSAEKFKNYVEGVEIVKQYLSNAKEMSDFKGIRESMFGSDIVDGRYINSSAKNYAAYSILGSKFNSALSFGTYDIRKSAREVKQGWMAEGESKNSNSQFDVGEDAITGEFFVKRKKATHSGNLVADGFKTEDDAINFINNYEKQEKFRILKRGEGYIIGRKYSDGRFAKLKDGLTTETEARKYLIDNIDDLSKMKGDDIAQREMVDIMTYGQDHRGSVDVTPEMFNDTFGFRGVEFGNWNSQAERQLSLNRAYDSLSDLAELLGIPQKAMSLNGELALAFGARGQGGLKAASAHYEPDRVVINLTKKAGAGTLAHEWAHALDNYFGKQSKGGFLSENREAGDVRADLFSMYKDVIEIAQRRAATELEMRESGAIETYKTNTDFLNSAKELDKSRKDPYWSTTREMFARVFEAYVGDKLRDRGIYNSYLVSGENNPHAYPLGDERVAINNALHKMQEEMKYRDSDNGHVELYAEVIPGIKKVVSFFDNWDEKVDAVYDGISNFARGVDANGDLKPKTLSNYRVVNWAKNLGSFMQENFVLGGARSDKLIDMLRSLNNHKSTVVNDAIKMREALAHLNQKDNQSLVRALGGDLDAGELNHNLRPIYDKFRKMIDDQTDALVAAGALDPKHARENYLKRYYFEYLKDDDFFTIFKGGTANSEKFKRKEMSLADRIAKGQIEDAGYVIAKTILEQRDQLLKAEFFQKLSDAYGVEKMQDGYVEVPNIELNGGVKKFGALNGKYVPYEVYESIKASSNIKDELGNIEKAANYWVKSVQHIKTNMTVKNIGTHLYNVVSNGYIAYLDGHLTNLAKILSDKNYYSKLKEEATRFGLDTMLDDMEAQFFKEHNPNEGALMKLYKNAYMAEGSGLGDAMRKAYEFEDVAFKLAAYSKRREALQFSKFLEIRTDLKDAGVINDMYNAYKYKDEISAIELSEAELEAAFKGVDNIYVNYGTSLPKGVAGLDRSGLMPFMHYSWKATPIFLKLMAKHPFKVAALHVAFAGFGASKIIGETEDRDKVTPEWMNDGVNILGVDNYVEVSEAEYLNIGRSVPAMRFLNMSPAAIFLGWDGGILSNVVGMFTTGVDNKGYSVDGGVSDAGMQRLAKRASAISEVVTPPLFPALPLVIRPKTDSNGKEIEDTTEVVAFGGRYFQKAYDALGGKKDKRGNPLEVTDVIKQSAGLKLQRVDKQSEAQKSVNSARKKFEREFNGAKTPKDRSEAKNKYMTEIKEVKEQLQRSDAGKLKINTKLPNEESGNSIKVFSKTKMIDLD